MFEKWHILAKNKHHIWKELGPKPCRIDFTGDSLIFSRKIITVKIQQNLGHFGAKRVNYVGNST